MKGQAKDLKTGFDGASSAGVFSARVAVPQDRAEDHAEAFPQGFLAAHGGGRDSAAWQAEWDLMIGQSPRAFYETLRRNIPGQMNVYLNLLDESDSNFNIEIFKSHRCVFCAENKLYHRSYGKFLYFKEWANKDLESGRRGIGLNLFKNMFDIARAGQLDGITLLGGRADGRFYWPAHGFYYRDLAKARRAAPQIAENLAAYSDTIPDEIKEKARAILAQPSFDMAWQIARLPGQVRVDGVAKPLGWALLNIAAESDYAIDLHDPVQCARVQESLAHLTPAAVNGPRFAPRPAS